MSNRKVFFSFHFDEDNWRVQQVRNMGVIHENPPLDHSEWEKLKRVGDQAIERWIKDQMNDIDCLVVLIGKHTATRSWVRYEINHAWTTGKAILGINIHNLKDSFGHITSIGTNPFSGYSVEISGVKTSFDQVVPVYDPPSTNAYNAIDGNIATLVDSAIKDKKN